MKITKIEQYKGDRYAVYIDDEYWNILDAEVILKTGLKKNQEVTSDFLDEVRHTAEYRKARERAYYLLGYRQHSEKELFDKLKKNVSEKTAAEVVALMIEQNLVNDEEYAYKLAEYYTKTKKWGKRKCLYEMQKKGIANEYAQNALEDCEVDTVSVIKSVIEKKYWRNLNFNQDEKQELYKGKKKTIAALLRLGFEYDNIKEAINEYLKDE